MKRKPERDEKAKGDAIPVLLPTPTVPLPVPVVTFVVMLADGKRLQAGYAWHACAEDAKNSNVASGFRIKRVDIGGKPIECISEIKIAGRPKAKHAGSHGQHSTAFATNREVLVAATIGRTSEEDTRASLCGLFANLLLYPAFTGQFEQPAAPDKMKTLVRELADPTSERCAGCTLDALGTLYLEIRDALPGASLNTGIGGKAEKSSRENILGKAEGKALKTLRGCEIMALNVTSSKEKDAAVPKEFAAACGRAMLKLYDKASEKSAGLEERDQKAQRATFLLSVAQAFPASFLCGAGEQLTLMLVDASVTLDELKDYFAAACKCARPLAAGNLSGARPMPVPFVATCTQGGGGAFEISFAGRSDSVKDSGTMGDHTCSEQLMKNAASTLLLNPGKKLPNCLELAARLEGITKAFSLDNYAIFDFGMDTASLYELSEEELMRKPELADALVCQERYNALKEHIADLSALIEQLRKQGGDIASAERMAEAAEKYMTLVDDRPTSVNFSGVASGHGEAGTIAVLNDLEQSKSITVDAKDPFKCAIGLFDCKAAYQNALLFNRKSGFEIILSRTCWEFGYFVEQAYPKVFGALLKHYGGNLKAFVGALMEEVTRLATEEPQTKIQRLIELQIGDEIDEEAIAKVDKDVAEGKLARRSSTRDRKRTRRDPKDGYEDDDEEKPDK